MGVAMVVVVGMMEGCRSGNGYPWDEKRIFERVARVVCLDEKMHVLVHDGTFRAILMRVIKRVLDNNIHHNFTNVSMDKNVLYHKRSKMVLQYRVGKG